jgi:hypothetical protein
VGSAAVGSEVADSMAAGSVAEDVVETEMAGAGVEVGSVVEDAVETAMAGEKVEVGLVVGVLGSMELTDTKERGKYTEYRQCFGNQEKSK